MQNGIPINIIIKTPKSKIKYYFNTNDNGSTIFNQCLTIYSTYFENEAFDCEYKAPKCHNKMCTPRCNHIRVF